MFIVENQHIEGVTHLYQCQNILQGTLYSLSFRVCVCVCEILSAISPLLAINRSFQNIQYFIFMIQIK